MLSSNRLSRIPKRIKQDLKIIKLAVNWRELLAAKLKKRNFSTIELRNGVVISAPPEISLNFLFHEIWIDEVYSPSGYRIRNADFVLDIGANVGVFALFAATRADDVQVQSYEPFPENVKWFERNVKASMLSNVDIYALAVADTDEERKLIVKDAWILHSLADKTSSEAGDESDIVVHCTTLDSIMADVESCHLLKLDCEGSEYEILYSAKYQTLQKIERIVCEFNNVDDARKNGRSLQFFLESMGFDVRPMGPMDEESGFFSAARVPFGE